MIVLVPAYEPDERLVHLLDALAAVGAPTVVVDDGSGPAHAPVFAAARARGATVLTHATNLGKGAALRTGLAHVLGAHPGEDVVCADCDGQHSVVDLLRVAERVRTAGGAMVLGARGFTGTVPLRSRLGNAATRAAFHLATGVRVQDTQTGLRGYPAALVPWLLTVPGDRFEYELALLLRARGAGVRVVEVPVATIYLDENASSHFRPVADSVRVWLPLVRFVLSSLGAFALDTLLLLVLHALTGSLLTSVVAARAVSASVNFATNRRVVFPGGRHTPLARSAAAYAALAIALLAAGYTVLWTLTTAGLPLLAAKVVTELVLAVAGYAVQQRHVFVAGRGPAAPLAPGSPAAGPGATGAGSTDPGSTGAAGATTAPTVHSAA